MKKRYLIISLALVVAPFTVSARIFESISDCDARYGKPTSIAAAESPLSEKRTYSKNGFTIAVAFLKTGTIFTKTEAHMLSIAKDDGSEISVTERRTLMDAQSNGSTGNIGRPMPGKHFWSSSSVLIWNRADGQVSVGYFTELHKLLFQSTRLMDYEIKKGQGLESF